MGCPVGCRTFSSIPVLGPLDASGPPSPVLTTKMSAELSNVPRREALVPPGLRPPGFPCMHTLSRYTGPQRREKTLTDWEDPEKGPEEAPSLEVREQPWEEPPSRPDGAWRAEKTTPCEWPAEQTEAAWREGRPAGWLCICRKHPESW